MLVTFAEAALELKVGQSTLRRWIRDGAPQARRGRPGRDGGAMLDIGAIKAWRNLGSTGDATALILASDAPNLLAAAIWQVFCDVEGPHKLPCAGVLVNVWFQCAWAIHERLAQINADVPNVNTVPKQISHLRDICAHSGKVAAIHSHP